MKHYSALILPLLVSLGLCQTLPTGPRLKDINNRIQIGGLARAGGWNTNGLFAGAQQAQFATVVNREFSLMQTPWYPAWGGWNGEGNYNFTDLNRCINWGKANGKYIQVHMLVGQDLYKPSWLVNGTWSNDQLDALLKNMIYSIMDANDNKTKVDVWNVVNEVMDDSGHYRKNLKFAQLGWETDVSGLTGAAKINAQHPVFIGKAFRYSRDKTTAKLELRDYYFADGGPKYHAYYQLVKHMLAKGHPIDAIGEQGHVNSQDDRPPQFGPNLKSFKDLGLEVYMSEVDLNNWPFTTWNAFAAASQRNVYRNLFTTAINAGVTLISTWGVSDHNDPDWLMHSNPLPFDENHNAKPAYYGIQDALLATQSHGGAWVSIGRPVEDAGSETRSFEIRDVNGRMMGINLPGRTGDQRNFGLDRKSNQMRVLIPK